MSRMLLGVAVKKHKEIVNRKDKECILVGNAPNYPLAVTDAIILKEPRQSPL